MANIIVLLREESNQSALENGVAGVGGLQSRELGYTEAAQEFSFKSTAGPFRHITSKEKMATHVDAATSGAKGVGYFPASGMASVDVQAAIDELRSMVASGGSGTVGGTGTTGTIPKFSASNTLANSILSEASSKLIFSADSSVNLYRYGGGILKTDSDFVVAGAGEVDGIFTAGGFAILYKNVLAGLGYAWDDAELNGASAFLIDPSLTKNTGSTRQFYGLRIAPTLAAGGSNAATTLNVLDIDTVNSGITGLTTRLLKLSYGGAQKFLFRSDGSMTMAADLNVDTDIFLTGGLFGGGSRVVSAPANNEFSNLIQSTFSRNVSGSMSHSLMGIFGTLNAGGSNVGETLDLLRIDTTNTSVTGMSVNLLRLFYGGVERIRFQADGCMGLGTNDFGSGAGVIGIKNAITNPSVNPGGGGVLYVDSGALKYRGSSGTVTTVAAA